MKTRLGLDLGTNSLGWSLLELNENGNPFRIVKTGVRIFSSGRESKSNTTLNAVRREKRLARRTRDRYLQRRTYLMKTLIDLNLMPEDEKERKKLQILDPYELRAKAVKEKIEIYEIGRILFHINQRRGFKSNRKDPNDKDSGDMKKSIKEFKETIEKSHCKTMGEYLYSFHQAGNPVRARRREENKGPYNFYPERNMLEEEFKIIWESQRNFHNQKDTLSKKNQETIYKIIFFQRPLRPQIVGKCTFFENEERVPHALISFQKFRLWQEINTLKYRNSSEYRFKEIPLRVRKNLFKTVFSKTQVSINGIEKTLTRELHEIGIRTNYVRPGSKPAFKGNQSLSAFKKLKKELSDKEKDDLILKLFENVQDERDKNKYRALSDDEIKVWLEENNFSQEDINYILSGEFERHLPSGHSHLSRKAIEAILPHLSEGDDYSIACEKSVGSHSEQSFPSNEPKLPRYNNFASLQKDCIPRQNNPDDKRIPNPTVHIAMNQLRLVVNDIIDHLGKPDEIVIELARDLPMGVKTKREFQNNQKKNADTNKRINKELEKLGRTTNRSNREYYKLWEELGPSPHDRMCPYSGKKISCSDLFSSKIEVDHILPYSKTLDNSLANKVLCIREENRSKKDRSPFQAFRDQPEKYREILARAKKMKANKAWRFDEDALDRFEEEGGFLERQLNDTRYISKVSQAYLKSLLENKNNCWTVKGQLTSGFRYHWGCNNILSNDKNTKNRDDHRHHAIDATIIALTSRSMIKKISTHASKTWEGLKSVKRQDNPTKEIFKEYPRPWKNFREDLKKSLDKIIVSHKPTRHYEGQMHEDSAYGILSGPNKKGEFVAERRIDPLNIKKTNVDKIVNDKFREELKDIFEDKKQIENFKERHGIKKIRIREEKHLFRPVGEESKTGFIGGSNWAYDLYEEEDGTWNKYIIPTFEIYKHMSKKPKNISKKAWASKYQPWKKENPKAKLIARLCKNDLFHYSPDGKGEIFQLKGCKTNSQLTYIKHNLSNKKEERFIQDTKKLKSNNFFKVNISPAGFYHAMENR